MSNERVVVIGAGIAGLVAAWDLASRGFKTTVLEKADQPGGKIRQIAVDGALIDSGPTVFTMKWVFEKLFQDHGQRLQDHMNLSALDVIARHAWPDRSRLDLHGSTELSAQAIEEFAGTREADGFLKFSQRAAEVFDTLDTSFMQNDCPSVASLTASVGLSNPRRLWNIRPFAKLYGELSQFFKDPRLRQLFGRYATYSGSSPFLSPATLMLITHAEQRGVWRIDGGIQELVTAITALAREAGVDFATGCEARSIDIKLGRVTGVTTTGSRTYPASAVVFCGDEAALRAGCLGGDVQAATSPLPGLTRSLSAVTVSMLGEASGMPLEHHNVFFCSDYAREFSDIFDTGCLPRDPTIYLSAGDRGGEAPPVGRERLFAIINAPPNGDVCAPDQCEIDRCLETLLTNLRSCGLELEVDARAMKVTTQADFHRMFPATGGALYGMAMHGPKAAFQRPKSRTRIKGLYLAGGSTHPGPGIPMAATSGRMAAARVLSDLSSTRRSTVGDTFGGMWTR